jgi:hypothetical protein
MPEMFCPRCGRELVLDSGETRFCRYCGFSLVDTKEALHGFSEQKRQGFSIVTWSYVVLLLVTLLLHGRYVSLDTRWVYWLLTALIITSASFFIAAAASALKPAIYLKSSRRGRKALGQQETGERALATGQLPEASQIQPSRMPVTNLSSDEALKEPRSIVEDTTKRLNE